MCWGLSFVWYKQALINFKPITLVLLRLIISFPLLISALALLKKLKKIRLKDFYWFMLLAFFEPFLYFMGESIGMQFISSTLASIIIATVPLFTTIIAYFVYQEKLFFRNYFGMAVSFIGVIIVAASDFGVGDYTTTPKGMIKSILDNTLSNSNLKGVGLIFISVFSAVFYGLIIKHIASKYNPLTIVTVQNSIGIFYFFIPFWFFEREFFQFSSLNLEMLKPVLFLAVLASTIAYLGFIQGLRSLGVSKATMFANFIPVFTAVFAYIILKENLSPFKISGIILVVIGLFLSQLNKIGKKETVVDELY